MKKILLAIPLIIFPLLITGCAQQNNQNINNDAKIKVLTTILPITEFISKIGGEHVEVEALIPPGYDPHSYELTPEQLQKISDYDLYVKAGYIEFELANMDKISAQNSKLMIINGAEGIELRNMEEHHHAEEGVKQQDAAENAPDPHTWLSVSNAKKYAENITAALIQLDPENKADYEKNKADYYQELTATGDYLKQVFDQIENKEIIVYHPAFGYLFEEYGLIQVPIEISGKEPTAAQLAELIKHAKEHGIEAVFVQQQFSTQNAEVIADEINGTVVPIDPLAADFSDNLKNIADVIATNK